MGSGHNKQKKAAPEMPVLDAYPGPAVCYHFLVVNATLTKDSRDSLIFKPSNVEQYFPSLVNMYQHGFRLLANVCLPVSSKTVFSENVIEYQARYLGCFRKVHAEEMENPVRLNMSYAAVVNKIVDEHTRHCNVLASTSNYQDIFNVVNKISSEGGRIVCLEYADMGKLLVSEYRRHYTPWYDSESGIVYSIGPAPEMHLKLGIYYETPLRPQNEKYNYDFVVCPMSMIENTFQLNWVEVSMQYLSKGWRLVDIFNDYSSTVVHMHSCTEPLLFIFEKPASQFNNNTPVYELTVVEKWLSSVHFTEAEAEHTSDVEPILNHMAKAGWEVVCILETRHFKSQRILGLDKYVKYLVFLQRRIFTAPANDSIHEATQPAEKGRSFQ